MEQKFILKDAYLFWPEWKRFIYRVVFQIFVYSGLLAAVLFILLPIQKYFYLGILLSFFFIFVLIKRNFSDFTITEQNLKKPRINLALFLSPRSKDILIESRYLALKHGISLPLACFFTLLNQREIINALAYLDFTADKIKKLQDEIIGKRGRLLKLNQEALVTLVQNALVEAQELKQGSINTYSLMLGLYTAEDRELLWLLERFDIIKNDLAIAFVISIISRKRQIEQIRGLNDIDTFGFRPPKTKVNRALTSRPTPTLDTFSVDFTELARRLKIGIMIGHLQEYAALIKILSRTEKRNVILVGPTGIGKETIVSYLAYNLVRNSASGQLRDYRLVNLPFSVLFKDVQTPFEACNRLTKIVQEILFNNDIILYLPQLHNYKLLAQEGGLSAFELLKPLFESQCPIIASTSPEDYRRYLEQDSDVKDSFEIIRVEEVSPEEAIKILALRSLRWRQETKIQVSYHAIKRAVMLAHRFLGNTPLPSSAESLLTEAIEGVRQKKQNLVTERDIVDLVSVKARIPLEIYHQEERERLLYLEKYIHQSYINQEEAVKLVAGALRQYRAGLANPNKPIGVFLFVGPTGVGKTELSKILARIYFGTIKAMVRFDMSEYQDQRGVFRFIGSPEGETRGALTEAIKEKPFSLILFDEFEKAHPKVLELFLPLFDEGRLTDNFGQTINFTNTIIIVTSNALSDFIKKEIEKKTDFNQISVQLKQKLTNYFKPELINRFDEIVVFRPLTEDNLKEIVKLKLKALIDIMKNKKITLDFDDSVIERLAQLGYNPMFGARPVDAVIRHFIKDKLARLILEEELYPGSKIRFVFQNDEFIMTIEKTPH